MAEPESVVPYRRATIRDVARLAGVHPSTVSRVLNGDDRRAVASTRQLIRQAVETLGWKPSTLARSLSTGRAHALGFLIPNLRNPAYAAMISGADQAASELDTMVLLAEARDEDRATRHVEQLVGRVDGLVVASAIRNTKMFDLLEAERLPYVLLNRRAQPGLPAVIGDDEAGVSLAVDHLVGLGHRRIAHIRGPVGIDTADRRCAAFEAAMSRNGLDLPPGIVFTAEQSESGGIEGARHLLSLPKGARPTAVFAVNLLVAVGGVAEARAQGLEVPRDVSFVGFDDWPLADRLEVPMTTVRMPSEEMGRAAVALLQEQIDGATLSGDHLVPIQPILVVRSSTSPPP